MKDELIAGMTTFAGYSLGSITVGTIPLAVTTTASAGGIAGWLGFTTAAPITVPVGGIVAVGALLTYGGYKIYKQIKS
ncbi:hypothetical protein [Nostoc sp.]|uniref:hypothetical protein n=1 Tax=Nostoc sp. TaxID=1180 RepID=UPI0035935EDF